MTDLADTDRGVAVLFEMMDEGFRSFNLRFAEVGITYGVIIQLPGCTRQHPGEQGPTGGPAGGDIGKMVGKNNAFFSQEVQIWRLYVAISVTAQFRAQVVHAYK